MQLRLKQATKKKKSLKQLASGSSSEIVTHTLHWALCDYYLESVGLSPVFYLRSNSRNHQPSSKVEKDEVHTNVQFAISTLQDLLVNETNLVVVLSTRLALAKLLIKYTTDWESADENLRMVVCLEHGECNSFQGMANANFDSSEKSAVRIEIMIGLDLRPSRYVVSSWSNEAIQIALPEQSKC